jgi:hypothetical protein
LNKYTYIMANCIKTLGAYYGRPTWFEKVFPSSRPWSVRTVAPPKLTLGTDLKTKFVTVRHNDSIDSSCVRLYNFYANLRQNRSVIVK